MAAEWGLAPEQFAGRPIRRCQFIPRGAERYKMLMLVVVQDKKKKLYCGRCRCSSSSVRLKQLRCRKLKRGTSTRRGGKET